MFKVPSMRTRQLGQSSECAGTGSPSLADVNLTNNCHVVEFVNASWEVLLILWSFKKFRQALQHLPFCHYDSHLHFCD